MRRQVSAGIVLFRERGARREYLLLHYPSGHWDFVKGKMEGGETPRQTALREAEEETGITDARFVEGFREEIEYEFMHAGETVRKRVVLFLAETSAESVTISHEHLGYRWAPYEEAMGITTFENARAALSRAARRLR